jgi:ribosomal protein S13
MTKELNEDSGFKISIKTLIGIGAAMATIISMWFVLQSDIAEARELPKPDVTRMEFDMKDQNIRQSIQHTEKTVDEIKEDLQRMEDKIDDLR